MRAAVAGPIAAALLFSACGQSQDTTPPAPPAPADAPAAVDFSRPLNGLGNEPFWAIKIRPEGLTFSAPDTQDIAAENRGPKLEAAQATWASTGSDGKPVVAVLKAAVCQDAMSGLSYPFTATVQAGGRTLSGCGAYADDMPRQGG